MAKKISSEVDHNIQAGPTNDRADVGRPPKCDDIEKCVNKEDKRMKKKKSTKSLFANLFSRKKTQFVRKIQFQSITFLFFRKVKPSQQIRMITAYHGMLPLTTILVSCHFSEP